MVLRHAGTSPDGVRGTWPSSVIWWRQWPAAIVYLCK